MEYANAAIRLEEHNFFSVRYFLFGHAFELILKSYIFAKGADEKKVKSLSHSLIRTYNEADRLGHSPSNGELPTVIEWLDPFHASRPALRRPGQTGDHAKC